MAEDVAPAGEPRRNPFEPAAPPFEAPVPAPAVRRANRAERARQSAYRHRFVFVYFALAIVLGSGVGAFIVVAARPEAKPPAPWSSFVPKGSITARLFAIAESVPKHYRGTDGKQLVGATVSSPQQQTSPDNGQTFVTLPLSRVQIFDRGNITTANLASSIQFTLCGDGFECELKSGTPSQARYYLLEREALELSLYAFKYADGLESVTVLLPPSRRLQDRSGQLRQTALFLQRKDVQVELSRPLVHTLAVSTPRVGRMSNSDLAAVRQISIPHTYDWSVGQAQDGAFVRQLQPAG